jgi:hypothetical protein
MPGYSGTPLAKKLGINVGSRVCTVSAPANYTQLLTPLPRDVAFTTRRSAATDIIHIFATRKAKLAGELKKSLAAMRDDAAIWVSWPKRASKVETDITEDVIREVALPMGLVDIKVCAVDETWSGLKLVVRKEHRKLAKKKTLISSSQSVRCALRDELSGGSAILPGCAHRNPSVRSFATTPGVCTWPRCTALTAASASTSTTSCRTAWACRATTGWRCRVGQRHWRAMPRRALRRMALSMS